MNKNMYTKKKSSNVNAEKAKDSNNSNCKIEFMNFDSNNQFFAQLFRYRYDSLTFEREKERDNMLNTRSSNFLISHYPPYGIFRAAEELTKEKIVYQEFEYFSKQNDTDGPDSLNMVRLSQTADILNSVLKESEEKSKKIKSLNAQFIEFQKNYKEFGSKI